MRIAVVNRRELTQSIAEKQHKLTVMQILLNIGAVA